MLDPSIHNIFSIHTDLFHTSYDILGSMLACSSGPIPSDTFSTGAISLLQDAEGNHCSSFPVILLQLMRTGAQLSRSNHQSSPIHSSTNSQQQTLLLLHSAQFFDPFAWAMNLQSYSPATDIVHRAHVASAHRAAVCIYLSRVLLSLDSTTTQISHNLETLVADIITHLSFIRPSDALFTSTTWPAFIAGAETNDGANQEWVAKRFRELWKVEPWGLIRGALGVLERIWADRRNVKGRLLKGIQGEGDWIGDLRGRGVDWLIL